jgi:hypothetical protein
MSAKTEGHHTGEFILSEAPGTLSRDNVTVLVPGATTLPAGTVLAEGIFGIWAPITDALAPGTIVGVLYGPLTNEAAEPAAMTGVVVDAVAEVRGADLDWNDQAALVQALAMLLLRGQGVKVRDYTPLGS